MLVMLRFSLLNRHKLSHTLSIHTEMSKLLYWTLCKHNEMCLRRSLKGKAGSALLVMMLFVVSFTIKSIRTQYHTFETIWVCGVPFLGHIHVISNPTTPNYWFIELNGRRDDGIPISIYQSLSVQFSQQLGGSCCVFACLSWLCFGLHIQVELSLDCWLVGWRKPHKSVEVWRWRHKVTLRSSSFRLFYGCRCLNVFGVFDVVIDCLN